LDEKLEGPIFTTTCRNMENCRRTQETSIIADFLNRVFEDKSKDYRKEDRMSPIFAKETLVEVTYKNPKPK